MCMVDNINTNPCFSGTIPVGIVSASRRMPEQEKPSSAPLPPSGPLVSSHAGPPVCGPCIGPSTWTSGPPPPWPMPGQPPPGGPPPSSAYGHPYGHPGGPPMGMAPPGGMAPAGGMAGPIPMGYQLAKDPMTGQILLIPTDQSGPRPLSTPGFGFGFEGLGSFPPGMTPGMAPGMAQGMPPGMPPTSLASQHLHQLMLQQQHMSYM